MHAELPSQWAAKLALHLPISQPRAERTNHTPGGGHRANTFAEVDDDVATIYTAWLPILRLDSLTIFLAILREAKIPTFEALDHLSPL